MARDRKKGPRGVICTAPETTLAARQQQRGCGDGDLIGRTAYGGSVKKLELNCHGRNASASVGTMTVNGCWSTLTAQKPPAHPQE